MMENLSVSLDKAKEKMTKAKEMIGDLKKGLLPQPAPISKKDPIKVAQQSNILKEEEIQKMDGFPGVTAANVATPPISTTSPFTRPSAGLAMNEDGMETELIKFSPSGQWTIEKKAKEKDEIKKEEDLEKGPRLRAAGAGAAMIGTLAGIGALHPRVPETKAPVAAHLTEAKPAPIAKPAASHKPIGHTHSAALDAKNKAAIDKIKSSQQPKTRLDARMAERPSKPFKSMADRIKERMAERGPTKPPKSLAARIKERMAERQELRKEESKEGESGQPKVAKVMRHFSEGKLHHGTSGKVVKDPKVAQAIAMSMAGLSNKK